LQTQRPYRSGLYDLKGTLFSNLPEIVKEARRWLKQSKPAALILGENQDGLAFEHPYKRWLSVTPLELLIPLFERENEAGHTLIILSKFTETEYAEALGPQRNVVYSWSLSLPSISRAYERGVSPLESRIAKANELKRAGYRIRFRLDALAPVENWQSELEEVMSEINIIAPEMLTVGALRATNPGALKSAAESNMRDSGIFVYISGKDPSGFKHRTAEEFQVRAFARIRELLAPGIALGLCKEDRSIWDSASINWQGCHCLHGSRDLIAIERMDC